MNLKEKKISRITAPGESARMIQTIVGCKWSMTVYQLLAIGINRPGEMVRSVDGLTTKVLNQCLRRNIDFGILVKKSYPEIPPRVEYEASDFGIKFMAILDSLEAIQQEFDINDSASAP